MSEDGKTDHYTGSSQKNLTFVNKYSFLCYDVSLFFLRQKGISMYCHIVTVT